MNAFTARLATARIGFDLYAIWALRQALEDEPWSNASDSTNEESTESQVMSEGDRLRKLTYKEQQLLFVLDGLVPAAAQWIFYAGHFIYNSQQEWEKSETRGDPARGGDKWNGKKGFCKERWDFWKSRFSWVAELPELMDETKTIATQAVAAMINVENDPQTEHWKKILDGN